jgi:uncharacterized membrane-anchored protein YjiN (DUF445 family)
MKKQILNEEFARMQKLAGLITESESKLNKQPMNIYTGSKLLDSYLEELSKQVTRPDILKNNYNLWDNALYFDYDTAINDGFMKANDFEISKEEYNKLHDELNNKNDAPFNYFVFRWLTGDEEPTWYDDEMDKDIEYFKTKYNVDSKTANIMKKMVDNLYDWSNID